MFINGKYIYILMTPVQTKTNELRNIDLAAQVHSLFLQ